LETRFINPIQMYKKNTTPGYCYWKSVMLKYALRMKLSCILLAIGFLQLNAHTYAQHISINKRDATLVALFKDIKKQSGYHIFYDASMVRGIRPITVNIQQASLEEALAQVLKGSELSYKVVDKNVIIAKAEKIRPDKSPSLVHQNNRITGKVTDEGGNPLEGVTVAVKGTLAATTTNVTGDYQIVLPDGARTLIFSIVGYEPREATVSTNTVVNITLKTLVSNLDEVVVVGYGTQRRGDLTGAISSVTSQEISEVASLNAMQAIQGKVAGVNVMQNGWNPGSDATIRIRGRRSFNASNDPLYVIDGIPIVRGLNEINPSEIESMEVLKDASATAIYGSRGANGVVLITTKRGKTGKTSVTYDGYVGNQTPLRLLDIMDGPEFAEFVRETYRNRTSNPYNSPVPSLEEDQRLVIFTQDPYILESVTQAYDENGNYDPARVRSFDWVDAILRDGFIQNHQLGITGGTEKTQLGISGGYYGNQGIMRGMDYGRYSIRVNLDHQLSARVKVGTSSVFSYVEENAGSELYGIARQQNPLATPYNPDGTLLLNPGNDALAVNPLLNIEGVINEHRRNRTLSNLYGEISIIDELKFRTNLGIDFRTARDGRFRSSMSTNQNGAPAWAEYGGNYSKGFVWENFLTYDKEFNAHRLTVTALQSIQSDRMEQYGETVRGLPYEYQWFYNVGSATENLGVRSDLSEWRMMSWMGRVNYSFLGKYMLTLSGRSDGSSVLAPGHKYAFFPSAAFAWRLSDEGFFKNAGALDDLKLRIGYGMTGNSAISPYQTQGSLSLVRYSWDENVAIGYAAGGFPNARLGWETTSQVNFGLDFSWLQGRISGVIDVYQQNTKDLLMERQLPVVSGFSSVLENVGKTRNTGLEISVSTVNYESQQSDFSWSTDWLFNANREEIVELYGGKRDDIGNTWFIGHPIGVFYDHQFAGIWQDTDEDRAEMAKYNANGHSYEPGLIRLVDQNGDYRINAEDRIILGNDRAKWIGGLTNRISWKGLEWSFQLYANIGPLIRFDKALRLEGRWNTVNVNYWTPQNKSNEYPKPSANWETPPDIGTVYYQDGSFVRLRYMTLGYNIPQNLVQRMKMSRLRVYFTAQNPYLWTKFDGLDPEGARGFNTPSPKTFMLGINMGL